MEPVSNITLLDTNQDEKTDHLLPGNVYRRFRLIADLASCGIPAA
jgi:hypothetical protein